MPLVAHSTLPAFQTLKSEGVPVGSPEQTDPALPHLRVGLLNLMPDAALRATDRQFIRLASAHAERANLWVYPFTVAAEARGTEAREHVAAYYPAFDQLREEGLDALIVSGANPAHHDLADEPFWPGLVDVLDWAEKETGGVLCSCLATHGVLQKNRGLVRERLPAKRWGVYSHKVLDDHPLIEGLEGPVIAPHSHWYDITRERFEEVGARVLVESDEAGVHMATSEDGFYVFFQGHPEYEAVSLLKEYQREMARYVIGGRQDLPPYPDHYFTHEVLYYLEKHRDQAKAARRANTSPPPLPGHGLIEETINTWTDPGRVIFSNWLSGIQSGT